MRRSPKSITSSNGTNISEMSCFSSASNTTTEINARGNSNSSLIFGIDGNAKNQILPMRYVLILQ